LRCHGEEEAARLEMRYQIRRVFRWWALALRESSAQRDSDGCKKLEATFEAGHVRVDIKSTKRILNTHRLWNKDRFPIQTVSRSSIAVFRVVDHRYRGLDIVVILVISTQKVLAFTLCSVCTSWTGQPWRVYL